MPVTHVILNNASLQLGADVASLAELACYANHMELTPDVSVTTLDTFCGSVDYPGVVKWSLIATLYQSWDDLTGTEAILEPLVTAGVPAVFVISADRSSPISATNPGWQGECIPQPYAPLSGDAGEASEIELEWGVVGEPTKIVAPPVATTTMRAPQEAAA